VKPCATLSIVTPYPVRLASLPCRVSTAVSPSTDIAHWSDSPKRYVRACPPSTSATVSQSPGIRLSREKCTFTYEAPGYDRVSECLAET